MAKRHTAGFCSDEVRTALTNGLTTLQLSSDLSGQKAKSQKGRRSSLQAKAVKAYAYWILERKISNRISVPAIEVTSSSFRVWKGLTNETTTTLSYSDIFVYSRAASP